MPITRRQFVASTAAAAIGTGFAIRARPAHAAEYTYKFANNQAVGHPMNVRAQEAAARMREESGGRFELQIFPSSQLGADTDMLSQVRSGGVEFFSLSPLILSTLVPNAAISGIGFAFPNYDAVWPAMDGALGAYARAQIAERGLVAMDRIWDNGFRQITSSRGPIATPADLEGFKIRVPVSPLWTSMFSAFGSAPTSINFAETYAALQTGVVDGQENPLAILTTHKVYEVQKYCSLTNHMWDGFWILANRRAFAALPDDIREIVARNFDAAAELERRDVMALNSSLRGKLEGYGMAFNQPDAALFQARLEEAGFYAEWKGKFGEEAWGILEAAVGRDLG